MAAGRGRSFFGFFCLRNEREGGTVVVGDRREEEACSEDRREGEWCRREAVTQ